MPTALSSAPKRIFVIGPMGSGKDRRGLALARHIPNIASATRQVLGRLAGKLGDTMPVFEVHEPPNVPGDSIPHAVFSFIMHCDFAIADISTGSPNVMYELAMLHANGVPVILLGKPIFYLNQSNCVPLEDFSIGSIEEALAGDSFDGDGRAGPLEQWIMAPAGKTFWNPITQHFGGVDMINVAAATGVATGQFYNFLRYVIKDGGVFQKYPELKSIILIEPRRIRDVNRSIGLLNQRLGEVKRDGEGNVILEGGAPVHELSELSVPEESHPRKKYFVKRKGDYLIDYPTPISSLSVSRQYLQIGAFLRDRSGGFDEEELRPFEERIIKIYFDTLRDLSDSPANECDWGLVKIMKVEEVIDLLSD